MRFLKAEWTAGFIDLYLDFSVYFFNFFKYNHNSDYIYEVKSSSFLYNTAWDILKVPIALNLFADDFGSFSLTYHFNEYQYYNLLYLNMFYSIYFYYYWKIYYWLLEIYSLIHWNFSSFFFVHLRSNFYDFLTPWDYLNPYPFIVHFHTFYWSLHDNIDFIVFYYFWIVHFFDCFKYFYFYKYWLSEWFYLTGLLYYDILDFFNMYLKSQGILYLFNMHLNSFFGDYFNYTFDYWSFFFFLISFFFSLNKFHLIFISL